MFPTFIRRYWIGLTANSSRTTSYSFAWTDPAVPAPSTATYLHWGRVKPADISVEPDNFFGMENCGVANYSSAYGGAFGWSDCQCNVTAPFMCRVAREWPQPAALVACAQPHLHLTCHCQCCCGMHPFLAG